MDWRLHAPQVPPAIRVACRVVLCSSLGLGVLLLLLVGADTPVSAGDPELAQFLFEGGKKAVQKRKYDDGIPRLKKALAEDENLIEAHYWIGYAEEKRGDVTAAVQAYRAFRDACGDCDTKLERGLAGLLRKTLTRLKALAAAESELVELNEKFVRRALAFARKSFVRDPDLARCAVDAVLTLEPANEEAQKLKVKIGGEAGGSAAASQSKGDGPTEDVVKWHDLLEDGVFGTNNGWTYANGMLQIDNRRGQFVSPKRPYESPKAYVYEVEGRILESYGKTCLGIMFCKHGNSWFACHLARGEICLWHVPDVTRKSRNDLVRYPMDPYPMNKWFRLAVAVKGNRIEVFLNGKKEITHVVKDRADFEGDIGTYQQDNHCEIRTLRMGTRR